MVSSLSHKVTNNINYVNFKSLFIVSYSVSLRGKNAHACMAEIYELKCEGRKIYGIRELVASIHVRE